MTTELNERVNIATVHVRQDVPDVYPQIWRKGSAQKSPLKRETKQKGAEIR